MNKPKQTWTRAGVRHFGMRWYWSRPINPEGFLSLFYEPVLLCRNPGKTRIYYRGNWTDWNPERWERSVSPIPEPEAT